MSEQLKVVSVIGFVFGVLFAQAQAAIITYHLQDVVFNDGGTADGSFDFDTETNAFSNVNIVTTAGSVSGGSLFNSQDSRVAGTKEGFFTDFDYQSTTSSGDWDYTGANFLLFFSTGSSTVLEDLGLEAVISLYALLEFECVDAECTEIANERELRGGRLVTYDPTIAPLPGALALFLSGLAGFGFAKRRKRAAVN